MKSNRQLVFASVGMCLLIAGRSVAEDTTDDQAKLPVKRIVLFNSGVGYFEHQGNVEGNQQVELRFTVERVNDLLKSMVFQDLGGGSISTVTYGSRNPVDEQLTEFSVDLRDQPTMGELLQQFRGERVRVDGAVRGVGTIVGLEVQVEAVNGNAVNTEILNLHTDEGLKSIPLRSVSSVQLLKQELNDELQRALAVVAGGRQSNIRKVALRFDGQGRRDVRVGYVLPTPVWKTTYRLVVDQEEATLLQGWAVVENVSDFDWNDVSMALVSGRPISFEMDLYSPLFVQRRHVPLDVMGSAAPRVYDPTNRRLRGKATGGGGLGGAGFGGAGFGGGGFGGAGFGGGGFGGGGFGGGGSTPDDAGEDHSPFDPSQGVASQGVGEEVGEFFRYDIKQPVTLSSYRSAMLPIVNEKIETEKLSIYTADAGPAQPLHALRLTNSTDVYWMAGPITVFESGIYAGDARIRDLPPGQQRLVSYAVDQDIKITRDAETPDAKVASASLVEGMLSVQRRHRRVYQYGIDYQGSDARRLVIEHPRPDGQWRVVTPDKPAETTDAHLRFSVDLAAGEAAELQVVEEWLATEELALKSLDFSALAALIKSPDVDDEVRDTLTEYVRLRRTERQLTESLNTLRAQVTTIQSDQSRIRGNMDNLDRTSSLYQRYVGKMEEQEDTLGTLVAKTLSVEEQVREVLGKVAAIAPDRQSEE